MTPRDKVLPREAVADLDRALRLLSSAAGLINKWESCGVDCQHYRVLHEELRQQLEAYKREFA